MSLSPVAVARALHGALEAGVHGTALKDFFTEDARTIERPNLIKPRGAEIALEQIMANSTAGAGLLAQQRYELIDAVAHDDLAILRLLWTGTIARDVGPFRAGQQLRAHIAQFVSTRDGRISKIETYDCYEPFSDGGSQG
jgi:ketosteroid isomerase-like protein